MDRCIDRFQRRRALRAGRPLHPPPHMGLRPRHIRVGHEEHGVGRLRYIYIYIYVCVCVCVLINIYMYVWLCMHVCKDEYN